jgi:type I restriction enzyme, S subunit
MTSDATTTWRTVRIDEVAEVNPDTTRGLGANRLIRYIDISSVDGSYTIAGDIPEVRLCDAPSRAKRLVRKGDILVSTVRSERRAFAVVPSTYDGAVASTGFAVLRATPELVAPGFLWSAVRAPSFVAYLISRQRGSNYPAVNAGDVAAAPFQLPPLDVQHGIAWVLGTLDDKIENNRRIAKTLKEIAATLFKARFVDFVDHDDLVESEIGPIPKGWRIGRLGDLLDEVEVGKRPRGGVAQYSSGIPSIGAESIVGLGVFDYSKVKFIPEEFFDGMKRGRVQDRDVLLYKDGGKPGSFEPHVTLVGGGFPFERSAINEHVYRLRASSQLGQNYLFFWLSSAIAMREMRVKGTGVAVPGLNSTQLKSLPVLVPSEHAIAEFDRTAEPLVAEILVRCKSSRTMALFRDALLPRLVSGQIRVPAGAIPEMEAA